MFVQRISLARLPVKVLAIRAAGDGIIVPEQTSLAQLREEKINDVLERLGKQGIRKVESIDVGLLDPRFESVCHLRGSTYYNRPVAADADVFCYRVLRPFGALGREAGIGFNSRPNKTVLD